MLRYWNEVQVLIDIILIGQVRSDQVRKSNRRLKIIIDAMISIVEQVKCELRTSSEGNLNWLLILYIICSDSLYYKY